MKQNKYDETEFFAQYSQMPRSIGGLDEAGEWQAFRALLPDLRNARVLDLGCGFGWHCRYAREQGARSVVGVDLSENMLARARATDDAGAAGESRAGEPRLCESRPNESRRNELSRDEFRHDANRHDANGHDELRPSERVAIDYRRAAIEEVAFPEASFDVILSSLALHYVERYDEICAKLHRWLAPGGACVLSVEHPVFTARPAQDWCYTPAGARQHWPVDDYQMEGRRSTSWMADDVVKYHRTMATLLNGLLDAGLRITRVVEPQPPASMMDRPGMPDELRRPMFLIVSAVKPA